VPNDTPIAPLLVSEREAARLLSCCAKTVYTLRQQGLPHVKIGSRVLYSPADLQIWINQQKVTAGENV
jgi:hypothetical protein